MTIKEIPSNYSTVKDYKKEDFMILSKLRKNLYHKDYESFRKFVLENLL